MLAKAGQNLHFIVHRTLKQKIQGKVYLNYFLKCLPLCFREIYEEYNLCPAMYSNQGCENVGGDILGQNKTNAHRISTIPSSATIAQCSVNGHKNRNANVRNDDFKELSDRSNENENEDEDQDVSLLVARCALDGVGMRRDLRLAIEHLEMARLGDVQDRRALRALAADVKAARKRATDRQRK